MTAQGTELRALAGQESTEPLDPARLAEIADRRMTAERVARVIPNGTIASDRWRDSSDDIPALLAEVDRLAEALIAERARVQPVEALAEPYLGQADGYQHYAINLTDGVHFVVLLEDLRAALAGDTEGEL